MTAYRIVHFKYAQEAFSGLGSAKFGGRWNSRGLRAIYTSENYSLSLFETLVHLRSLSALQKTHVMLRAEIPEKSVKTLSPSSYPKNWRQAESHPLLQTIGDTWFREKTSPVLRLKSSLIDSESNLLLNPLHPDFSTLTFGDPEIIDIDSRLLPL